MRRSLVAMAILVLSSCGNSAAPKPTPSPTPSASATPIASATTTALPLGRIAAAMAYDQPRHAVLLFGGLADQTLLDDTWTWNGSGWSQHQGLTQSPRARQRPSMAYDEANRNVVLFGGLTADGQQNDTWSWNGTAWQQLHPAHSPSAREGAGMTYDPSLKAVILYGGMNDATAKPSAINETWSWNGSDWSPLSPAQSPAGGVRPRLAFLSGANVVARFGDCIESNDNGLYTFDGQTWTAHQATGTWPPALCIPALAGDTGRNQLVLFGGLIGSAIVTPPPADTWLYDGHAWTRATPAQSPPARSDATMVFDSDHHVMVLFGGQGLIQGQTGPLNDTWTWDGNSWTQHQ
ncbi:MAG TPA: kelch repeat-containing protein [Candidatus Dormibacteraeota bacterium]|nr:kelch repeat-containing protein [Candidatus Dormibacteraeota bacterium]